MEASLREIAETLKKFTIKKCSAAFLDDSGNLLYSCLTAELEGSIKKLSGVFPVWNIGDYQLKKLPKGNVLIYKVSPHIILALESYENEGALIVIGKRLEENYGERFKSLESQLPAAPAKAGGVVSSEKSNLGLVQEDPATVEFDLFESLLKDTAPKEIRRETVKESPVKSPSAGNGEEIMTVSFPVLADRNILKKVKEPNINAILNLCDGHHTIDDICEELSIPKARIMIITGDYSAKGALKYISGIRTTKR
ncbi:MAG: hypothetical protein WED07_14160 [Candidatus Freyarchaeum deiterrae]